MSRSDKLLVDLSSLANADEAGSKAFNLGRTAKLDVRTPGGVVIPDRVFQQHLARAAVLPEIENLFAGLNSWPQSLIESTAECIRRRIVDAPLAEDLREAITRETGGQYTSYAVRSSAVGEDTVRTSFAGQLDSFLNVDSPAALEHSVKATWSSLFSSRVLLYCRHNKITVRKMGVIIQPLVRASWSGVLFTREPTGRHSDSMLLEYGPGLGDRLVSGEITPARLRIGRSDFAFAVEHTAPGVESPDRAAIAALVELANLGLRLEKAYGAAQDIEWCIDEANQLVIVQARPATAGFHSGAEQHWSNANIAENFPEPVSPFLYSIVRQGYSAYFRNLAVGFGLSRKRIDAMAGAFDNIVGLQGGRLYYNLSNIHALLYMMPSGARLVEFFNLFVGADKIPPPESISLSRLSRAVEAIRIAASVSWQYLFVHRRIRRFEKRVDRYADRTQPSKLRHKSPGELAADLSGFLKIRFEQWNDAALADTAAMVCYGALKAQLAKWRDLADQSALHNDLLKGLPGLASALPVEALWRLSRRIVDDDALRSLFTDSTADEILLAMREPAFTEFSAEFDKYLDEWGFRSSAELMLTKPTPVEDPRPLLDLLRAYVLSTVDSPEVRSRSQRNARLETTGRVAAGMTPEKWQRAIPLLSRASRFRILLSLTQGSIRLRERARMKQALLYTRLRHVVLALGERLLERGVLETREDVFMLTSAEVLALVTNSQRAAPVLAHEILLRRDALQQFQQMQPPDRLVLKAQDSWRPVAGTLPQAGPQKHVQALHGSGACGGSALGDAAVVLDVSQAGRVKAGQILVTRQTDPGWASVFFLVHGLVIERGGMLSHGAIIAREYGIPAVVGVLDATRVIRDGDRLRVDGDQGLVEFNHH
ncbi:MAG: PEP-utilizing enzyme [Gammaproteobacteria bacterium]|nr:PEP-utilizing enzyme [Gammaproteobacteria bacterium]MDH4313422.1 PEP-utilizing enzyme [Gammaproteobacteria bacterium]